MKSTPIERLLAAIKIDRELVSEEEADFLMDYIGELIPLVACPGYFKISDGPCEDCDAPFDEPKRFGTVNPFKIELCDACFKCWDGAHEKED